MNKNVTHTQTYNFKWQIKANTYTVHKEIVCCTIPTHFYPPPTQNFFWHFWKIKVFLPHFHQKIGPSAVAWSDARPPGMQTVAGSILTSSKTFFCWD